MTFIKRFWEIDSLRGIAIILMIIYHSAFDIFFLSNLNLNILTLHWIVFQKFIGILFILLMGISLAISHTRISSSLNQYEIYKKYVKRGGMIFFWGLLITLMTKIFLTEGTIIFGILHFIGLSIILAIPLLRKPNLAWKIGIVVIIIGNIFGTVTITHPYISWLGIKPTGFYSLDHYAIFPWFGVVLIGISIGKKFYKKTKRSFPFPELGNLPLIKQLSFIGKHSLLIYLLHQPVILTLLYLFNIISW